MTPTVWFLALPLLGADCRGRSSSAILGKVKGNEVLTRTEPCQDIIWANQACGHIWRRQVVGLPLAHLDFMRNPLVFCSFLHVSDICRLLTNKIAEHTPFMSISVMVSRSASTV